MRNFTLSLIDDPAFYKVHVLPARSDAVIRDSAGRPVSLSLNGMWRFHYADSPGGIIPDFEKPETDVSSWREIPVPSNIQFQGYDAPAYVNSQYPWDGRENLSLGKAPRRFNPTAQYVTFFEVPDAWKGQGLRIRFAGVESGFALWLNGSFAGYSEDSFTPSEFELTPFIKDGVNRLAVLDFKFTNGSWLEDQDMFRLSGIFRDVDLYPVPKIHIEDVKIIADLDESFTEGLLDVTLKLSGKKDGARIRWSLDRLGTAGCAYGGGMAFSERTPAASGELLGESPQLHERIKDVSPWSAESPALYELCLCLADEEGTVIETVREKIGFRHFELKDGLMCLNGKRIVFNGVNRHEFSCDRGRSPKEAEVEEDIRIMKRNNINAVRTSHYPNASYLYRLADLYGLYLIAETNMETHGSWCFPTNEAENILPNDHEEYLPMMLDRVDSQYERDKNHPSVLIWSLGNESFGGSVIARMSRRFREKDPTRLIHYEGVMHDRRYNDSSDIESQMYTSAAGVEQFLLEHPEKPFILCEYTHSMGNSNGGMHRYIELSERNPRYQGGFIWDFVDQAVRKKNRYGQEYLAYGGDSGERPTDYDFSGNGIIDARRRPYGKIQEIRYNYRPVKAVIEGESVTILNKNLFTPTSAYDCLFTVEREGVPCFSQALRTDVPPLEERTCPLPVRFTGKDTSGGDSSLSFLSEPGEYVLTVSFRLKEDTLWEKAGYEVAFGQKVVPVGSPLPESLEEDPLKRHPAPKLTGGLCLGADKLHPGAEGLEVIRGYINLGVRGEHFEVLFSGLKGGLVSYRFGGKELIEEIPRPNFWRAPISNDAGSRMASRLGIWKLASSYQEFSDPEKGIFEVDPRGEDFYPKISQTKDYVEIVWKKYLPVLTEPVPLSKKAAGDCSMKTVSCLTAYRVFADGTVRCILSYDPKYQLPPMPDFGWLFAVNADYDQVTYYGNGPEENYCDRRQGAKLGVYHSTASDMLERYLVPQESGNRTGVRWAKVTDRQGHGVLLSGAGFPDSKDPEASIPGTMEFSALPYSPDELENARHSYELPPIHRTFIRCSLKQMGVAGDDSWGARPHPEYLLPNDRRLTFAVDFKGI